MSQKEEILSIKNLKKSYDSLEVLKNISYR
ncbi:MAG: hypothetical protein K0R05_4217 [Anaerocolumna sp.]|nr:hypothetical protein [Anaerocolumna sp.]